MEHLIENPIFPLYHIHRVLKRDGMLVLSTPNVYRYENILKNLVYRKYSTYDAYSEYGAYGRHNREYSLFEIEEILANTGFILQSKATIDSKIDKKFKSKITEKFGMGEYLLVTAKKKEEFRWYFPSYLFRGIPGKMVINDYLIIGRNCNVQMGNGWHVLENWNSVGQIRWSGRKCSAYLMPKKPNNRLRIVFYSALNNFAFKVVASQGKDSLIEAQHNASSGWQEMLIDLPPLKIEDLKIELIMDL